MVTQYKTFVSCGHNTDLTPSLGLRKSFESLGWQWLSLVVSIISPYYVGQQPALLRRTLQHPMGQHDPVQKTYW